MCERMSGIGGGQRCNAADGPVDFKVNVGFFVAMILLTTDFLRSQPLLLHTSELAEKIVIEAS